MPSNPDRRSKNFNAKEQEILRSFKPGYLACLNAAERKIYTATVVWVALCQHWRRVTGKDEIPNAKARVQRLGIFVQNNWRLNRGSTSAGHQIRVRASSVVWDLYKDRVETEIKKRIAEAERKHTSTDWFPKFMPSVHKVWNTLTEEEKEKVNAETKRRNTEGLPVELKARNRRHMHGRLTEAAKNQFMQMDILSVNFYIFRNREGQVQIDLNEQISHLFSLGPESKIDAMFPKEVKLFKDTVARYFIKIRDKLATKNFGAPTPEAGVRTDILSPNGTAMTQVMPTGTTPGSGEYYQLMPNDYPQLKQDITETTKISKLELEDLLRKYLGQHYYLATGKRRTAVPWTRMIGRDRVFVDQQFVPVGFKFKHPRDMQKAEILELLHHFWVRQKTYKTLDQVWQFKMITASRKKNSPIVQPLYETLPPLGETGTNSGTNNFTIPADSLTHTPTCTAPSSGNTLQESSQQFPPLESGCVDQSSSSGLASYGTTGGQIVSSSNAELSGTTVQHPGRHIEERAEIANAMTEYATNYRGAVNVGAMNVGAGNDPLGISTPDTGGERNEDQDTIGVRNGSPGIRTPDATSGQSDQGHISAIDGQHGMYDPRLTPDRSSPDESSPSANTPDRKRQGNERNEDQVSISVISPSPGQSTAKDLRATNVSPGIRSADATSVQRDPGPMSAFNGQHGMNDPGIRPAQSLHDESNPGSRQRPDLLSLTAAQMSNLDTTQSPGNNPRLRPKPRNKGNPRPDLAYYQEMSYGEDLPFLQSMFPVSQVNGQMTDPSPTISLQDKNTSQGDIGQARKKTADQIALEEAAPFSGLGKRQVISRVRNS